MPVTCGRNLAFVQLSLFCHSGIGQRSSRHWGARAPPVSAMSGSDHLRLSRAVLDRHVAPLEIVPLAPWRNASTCLVFASAEPACKNPIAGNVCCAHGARPRSDDPDERDELASSHRPASPRWDAPKLLASSGANRSSSRTGIGLLRVTSGNTLTDRKISARPSKAEVCAFMGTR